MIACQMARGRNCVEIPAVAPAEQSTALSSAEWPHVEADFWMRFSRACSCSSDPGRSASVVRRVGQAEGERSANSFLPRAMMLPASKSLTRPAATSAKPLSISVLSAANSSI
jgi:hypothetical protein